MNLGEYQRLRRQLDEELRVGMEMLHAGHQAKVEALDARWQEETEPAPASRPATPEPQPQPVAPAVSPSRRLEAGELLNDVEAALALMGEEFQEERSLPRFGLRAAPQLAASRPSGARDGRRPRDPESRARSGRPLIPKDPPAHAALRRRQGGRVAVDEGERLPQQGSCPTSGGNVLPKKGNVSTGFWNVPRLAGTFSPPSWTFPQPSGTFSPLVGTSPHCLRRSPTVWAVPPGV